MNITHLLAPAAFGGLERVVQSLAVAQRDRGMNVCIAALLTQGRPEPALLDALRHEGIRVVSVCTHPRNYPEQIRAIRALCRDDRTDVLHTHGYLADLVGLLASRAGGPPVVSTAHGFTGNSRRSRLYEWLDRRAFRRFDAVVAVSRKLSDDLARSGVPRRLIHTIVNAWGSNTQFEPRNAARQTLAAPADVFAIGWIGRITVEKGLDVLVDALPHLRDLPFRATILGDGADRAALTVRATELGIADRITWMGATAGAARLLQGLDVLVISSRTEGTPMTLLEAMEAGTPIVATAVGGIPDVISEQHALLVPSENPQALAAAIRAVYNDRSAAALRAENARTRLQTAFAVEPWLDHYEQLYVSLRTQLPFLK